MNSQSVFPLDTVSLVESYLREVPDFPTPGVLFRDITLLIADPQALKVLIKVTAGRYRSQVDTIAGLESEGFILGAPLAIETGVRMSTARKGEQLLGPVVGVDYNLEHDPVRMELQSFAVADGQRVLVIDDILVTGGTTNAASELIKRTGGVLTRLCVLVGLRELGGCEKLADREVGAVLAC